MRGSAGGSQLPAGGLRLQSDSGTDDVGAGVYDGGIDLRAVGGSTSRWEAAGSGGGEAMRGICGRDILWSASCGGADPQIRGVHMG